MSYLLHKLTQVALDFWSVLTQMSPYLLFGFAMAGLLAMLISARLVERHLGGRGLWPVLKAALFGVPLPLCSCGVIPVAASLRRHGASRAATTSFLISTPQTGVDSIMVTLSLLGPVITVFRPVAALLGGLLGGGLVELFVPDGESHVDDMPACADACCSPSIPGSRLLRALHHGFVTLPADIAKPLLAGLVIAGLITALVPANLFSDWIGAGFLSYLVMLALGIPVYVCATASVPIAAAFILKGVPPGAALVFLMTGPATNAAAIATIWKLMGRSTVLLYLLSVSLTALASGLLLDLFFSTDIIMLPHHNHAFLPPWVGIISAVVLLAVLAHGLWRSHFRPPLEPIGEPGEQSLAFTVQRMTCSHCVDSVRNALLAVPGVTDAVVTLKPPRALVAGTDLNLDALSRAVQDAGYDITPSP